MSKRNPGKYPARDKDFWPTPFKAVKPLIPYLQRDGVRTFAEPCCGEGDLTRHLESFDFECVYQGDIKDGQDALAWNGCDDLDVNITNPPFSKKSIPLAKRLIVHLQTIAPTWLLLPWDWLANVGMAKYWSQCSDAVPIGRVKWIEDSEHEGGYENAGWFKFDARWHGVMTTHGRGVGPKATCQRQGCGRYLDAQRSTARFCSATCRKEAWRQRVPVVLR